MTTINKEKSVLMQSLVYVGKLISTAVIIILILIGIFLIYYVISAQQVKKSDGSLIPKYSLYTIISGSMNPVIKVYDVILTTRIDDPSTIKVGDIITFLSTSSISRDMVVTHRVLEIRKNPNGSLEFVTKGDNNKVNDPSEPASKLVGKKVFCIPKVGIAIHMMKNHFLQIILIIVSLSIMVFVISKFFKQRRDT